MCYSLAGTGGGVGCLPRRFQFVLSKRGVAGVTRIKVTTPHHPKQGAQVPAPPIKSPYLFE